MKHSKTTRAKSIHNYKFVKYAMLNAVFVVGLTVNVAWADNYHDLWYEMNNTNGLTYMSLDADYTLPADKDSWGELATTEAFTLDGYYHTINLDNKGHLLVDWEKSMTIQNVRIINGYENNGGVIHNRGNLTITNPIEDVCIDDVCIDDLWTVFDQNRAINTVVTSEAQGGAISNLGTLAVQSHFYDNTTSGYGGAIYNHGFDTSFMDINPHEWVGHIIYIRGNFVGNRAGGDIADVGYGGAIYNSGNSLIEEIVGNFRLNFANRWGGAIYNDWHAADATPERWGIGSITGNFIKNSATSHGGALFNLTRIDSITGDFINNFSVNGSGGAIYNTDDYTFSDPIIYSITGNFIKNSAYNKGGAIYNDEDAVMSQITGDFTYNSTDDGKGGAIYNENVMTITGSFYNNYAGDEGGAIYNDGDLYITTDDEHDIVFSGNKQNVTSVTRVSRDIDGDTAGNITNVSGGESNAIYNDDYVEFNAKAGRTIYMHDKMNDSDGYGWEWVKKGAGTLALGADMSDITGDVHIEAGTIKLVQNDTNSSVYGTGFVNASVTWEDNTSIDSQNNHIDDFHLGGAGFGEDITINGMLHALIDVDLAHSTADRILAGESIGGNNGNIKLDSINIIPGGGILDSGFNSSISVVIADEYTKYKIWFADDISVTGEGKTNWALGYTPYLGELNFSGNVTLKDIVNATSPEVRVFGAAENITMGQDIGSIGHDSADLTINMNGNVLSGASSYSGFITSAATQKLTINNAEIEFFVTTNQENGAFVKNENGAEVNIKNSDIGNSSAFFGGAISNTGILTTENTDFTSNSANLGGAIYNNGGGALTFTDTSFSQNSATDKGGVIYNAYTTTPMSTAPISITAQTKDVEFRLNNAVNDGASIYNEMGGILITAVGGNVTFTNNTTTSEYGYGIYSAGTVELNANAGRTIRIDDGISIGNSNLIVNQGDFAGIVELNGKMGFNTGITVGTNGNDAGILKLGATPATGTYSFVNAGNYTLDLQNNHAGDVLTLVQLSGTGTMNLNVDYDATANSMDKITVDAGSGIITLNAVNVINDNVNFDDGTIATYLDGDARNNVTVISDALQTTVAGTAIYTFTPDSGTHGLLSVSRFDYAGDLINAIQDDVGTPHPTAYSMQDDFTANRVFGALNNTNREQFTIFGNNHTISGGNTYTGIEVAGDQTLNLDNVIFADMQNYDVQNSGVLNLAGTNTINTIADATTPTGTTNVNNGKTIITGTLTQDVLNLYGELENGGSINATHINIAANGENIGKVTTSASNYTGLISNNVAHGVELTGGTLTQSITGGDGSTDITGAVDLGDGGAISQGIYVLSGGALTSDANKVNGVINNTGTYTVTGGTIAADVTGTGSLVINGTVQNNANIANIITINSGKTLTTNADTIADVVNNGVLNLSGGTLASVINGNGRNNIIGDVMIASDMSMDSLNVANGGSLDVGINTISLDKLAVDGVLKLEITDMAVGSDIYTGGHVNVDTLNLGNDAKLSLTIAPNLIAKGESTGALNIINVSGETTGQFADLLSNNRYTLTSDTNGRFIITNYRAVEDVIRDAGGSDNNILAGKAWDEVMLVENTKAQQVQNVLNDLSQHDASAHVRALTNLAPTDSMAVVGITQDFNNLLDSQSNNRLLRLGRSGGDVSGNKTGWVQALYNHSKQDSTNQTLGFTGKTAGLSMGFDGKVNKSLMLGLGYAYSQTDVNSSDREIDIDGHAFFAYAKYQPSKWYVRSMLNYGFAQYDEKADVAGISNTAEYNVHNYGARAFVGYDMLNMLTLESGLRYTHVQYDDYTDIIGQTVKHDDVNVLTAVMGTNYSHAFITKKGFAFTPSVHVNAIYDLLDNDTNATVNIADTVYSIKGEGLDRFGIEAGIGAEIGVGGWNLSAEYDLGVRNGYISHTGMLKAKYNF